MTMTRRDFEYFAASIRHHLADHPDAKGAIVSLALDLADRSAASNQRFDRKRFLAACGVLPNQPATKGV
jgi:hypothetical protein